MKKGFTRLTVMALTGICVLSAPLSHLGGVIETKAAETDAVTLGEGSYASTIPSSDGYYNSDAGQFISYASLIQKLPTKANEGTYRFTTENYDADNGAIDTSDWGTSFMWSYSGTSKYSNSVYAIPLSYKASASGMYVTNPSVRETANSYLMDMPEDGALTDFVVSNGKNGSQALVDKKTDWSYDVILADSPNATNYLKTTMVQGSPFAFFQSSGSTEISITRLRSLPSQVVYYNGSSASNSTMLVIQVYDNQNEVTTGLKYTYYALYAPSGTTWMGADASTLGTLKASLPGADKSYLTMAVLTQTKAVNVELAKNIAKSYQPYAYNFITDTRADYSYDETTGSLVTTYRYTVEKKAESTADGTVMGILPHQYKNMSVPDSQYLSNTLNTIRGTMKFLTGLQFTTTLTYTGILPWLTDVSDDDKDQLQTYIDEYMDKYFQDPADYNQIFYANSDSSVGTYWTGKALNRTNNVLAAAESVGDTEDAEQILDAVKTELEDWFTYSGDGDDNYFYYDKDVGSLFGFPEEFNSVDQINDHHFHYGYYIYAAAQVALRDPEWASESQYGQMVRELIDDIACDERNSADSRYPYLRSFSAYEGHSWASGHQNFADGNNQESSSEALNAWAGIILFGEAIGDEELRNLGIYLYLTEISAVDNYWFDVDENVLSDSYRYYGLNAASITEDTTPIHNQAAMVWGGKYDYGTWWTAEPLQVQGINLLPMNPSSFYLAKNKNYILENWKIAKTREDAYSGSDKMADPYDRWNDIWSSYLALSDTDTALSYWDSTAAEESGESRAHTYQYIKSLEKAGTPDLSITSDTALSTVFDKNGEKTYVVYNAQYTVKTVTFSDGMRVTALPGQLTTVSADITYTVETYLQNEDKTGYDLSTSTAKGTKGELTHIPSAIKGYTFDSTNSGNVLQVTLSADTTATVKLYYNRNTYTVNYVLNGGTNAGGNPDSYLYGQTITLQAPQKDGYSFAGWYLNKAFTNRVTQIDADSAADLTLYARWIDNESFTSYQVKYYKQNEEKTAYQEVVGDAKTVTGVIVGETVSAEEKSYEGYRFNANSISAGTVQKDGKLVLKMYYDYDDSATEVDYSKEGALYDGSKLTFYAGDASGTSQVLVYYRLFDTKAAAEAEYQNVTTNTAYPGYILEKNTDGVWTYQTNAASDKYIIFWFNKIINAAGTPSTIKLAAVADLPAAPVTKEAADYTVHYYQQKVSGNGYEEVTADTKALSGSVGNIVLAPQKTYTGFTLCDEVSVPTGVVAGDGSLALNLYYNRNVYTVAYNNVGDAVVGNPAQYVYGSAVSLAALESRDAVFKGWYTDAELTKQVTEISASTTGNLTLYAKWAENGTEPESVGYTINYYRQNAAKDGYTQNNSETVSQKQVGDLVSVTPPAVTGFTVNTTKSVLTGTVAGGSTLTLSVYYDRNTYTITYNNVSGAVHSNPASYVFGNKVTLTDASKSGSTFGGWYSDAALTKQVTEISANTIGNLTLYAKFTVKEAGVHEGIYRLRLWKEKESKNGYTLEDSQTARLQYRGTGLSVTAESETLEGYTLNTEKSVLKGTLTEKGLLLEIYYDRNTYSIRYQNMSGASNSNPSYYAYGAVTPLKTPLKKGYTFGGWYTDSKLSKKVLAIGADSASAVTLYAKWSKVTTPAATLSSVKAAGKGKVAVKSKQLSDINGYEILYSTDKSFKKSVKKLSGTSANQTITKLKKGKIYYVKVHVYKKDSTGARVYGKYSKVKKVTVK